VVSTFARVGIGAAVMTLSLTTFGLAETTATPAPKAVAQAGSSTKDHANPFSYRAYVRAYDFTRQNAFGGHSAANQQSFSTAIGLHGDYSFLGSGFDVGASYLYATPFGSCTTATSHFFRPCGSNAPPSLNPDDTLPGFELSTLYEAYLQYKANGLYFKGGNQVINTPWANASDSRLKPVAFQGGDVAYELDKHWTIEGSDYWQWECRTCSNFDRGTLLTTAPFGYAGAGALPGNSIDLSKTTLTNNGFFYGRVGYTGSKSVPLSANVYYYAFSNIANAIWFDAKYPIASSLKPFVALQAGSEANAGASYLGKISSTVFGVQAGFNPLHGFTLTGGFDTIPVKTDTVTLPAGFSCQSNGTIKSPSSYAGNLPYFLPAGGTGNCSTAGGTTNIYYGGWASPYTDSYATDPLFTTSLTQGMIDRRSPGNAFKVQATFTSDDKQFVSYISQAWYDYNNAAYAQSTKEIDFDALYYFKKLPRSGPYKGFSLRYRYGERDESPAFPDFSGAALFKYNRVMAEYDF
jgi:hypothetical protein